MNLKFKLFKRLPLLLCFCAFPLGATISRLFTDVYLRSWLDVAWVILVVLLIINNITNKRRLHRYDLAIAWWPAAILIFLLLRTAFAYGTGLALEVAAIPIELKLLLYIMLAGLIIGAVGVPYDADWGKAGVMLAAILLLDTAIESVLAGSLTRPQGSGEVNYDAMLLTIALGFLIFRPVKNNKQSLGQIAVILLALVATQSRTMLLAATLLIFFLSSFSIFLRLIILLIGIGGVFAMFMMRELDVSYEAVDRYWMWMSGINLLIEPSIFFFGVYPGQPLNVAPPEALQDLWEQQTENLTMQGVFPFNFHAFWLRFAINFGVIAALLIFIGALTLLMKSKNQIRRYLAGLFILSGFTMGSLYLSNVGVPFMLAIASCLRNTGEQRDV